VRLWTSDKEMMTYEESEFQSSQTQSESANQDQQLGSDVAVWDVVHYKLGAVWEESRIIKINQDVSQKYIHIEIVDTDGSSAKQLPIARGYVRMSRALINSRTKTHTHIQMRVTRDWHGAAGSGSARGSGGVARILLSRHVSDIDLLDMGRLHRVDQIPIKVKRVEGSFSRIPKSSGVQVVLNCWISSGSGSRETYEIRSPATAMSVASTTSARFDGTSTQNHGGKNNDHKGSSNSASDSKKTTTWSFKGTSTLTRKKGRKRLLGSLCFSLTLRDNRYRKQVEQTLGTASIAVDKLVPGNLSLGLLPVSDQSGGVVSRMQKGHDQLPYRVVFEFKHQVFSVELGLISQIFGSANSDEFDGSEVVYAEACLRSDSYDRISNFAYWPQKNLARDLSWSHCSARSLVCDPALDQAAYLCVSVRRSQQHGKDESLAEFKVEPSSLRAFYRSFVTSTLSHKQHPCTAQLCLKGMPPLFETLQEMDSSRAAKDMNMVNTATCLHGAAMVADDAVISKLVDEVPAKYVNVVDECGRNALYIATTKGHKKAVEALLRVGEDPDAKDNNGRTPLHCCAIHGREDITKMLLYSRASPNTKDKDGWTPMHFAACAGRVGMLKSLIEKGGDLEAVEKSGARPLHLSVSRERVDAVKTLILHGANVNSRDGSNAQPLHYAAFNGSDKIAEVMLEANAHVNSKDAKSDNWTPLHYAAYEGNLKLGRLFLDHKAEISVFDRRQQTPLHYACRRGKWKMVKFLVENKALIGSVDIRGRTPLHLGAAAGSNEVIEILLEANADPDARDPGNWTPLTAAASFGYADCVETLLLGGADPKIRNVSGMNALHCACFWKHLDVLKALVENNKSGELRNLRVKIPSGDESQVFVEGFNGKRQKTRAPLRDGLKPVEVAMLGGSMTTIEKTKKVFRYLVEPGSECDLDQLLANAL